MNAQENKNKRQNKLQYRKLGNSGLLVSMLGYGNYNTHDLVSESEFTQMIRHCLEKGINYFDTAQLYSQGKDEQNLGRALKQISPPRNSFVISTKIWDSPQKDINSKHSNCRKHVKEGLKQSLKRLQLDYVDVVYAHSYDDKCSTEQIARSFHEVIEQGLAFYWGTSNWDSSKVFQAFEICEKYNLHKPIAAQNQYNMVIRHEIEGEYRTLFQKYRYGLAGYSPLQGGYLTGKYLDGKPPHGRLEQDTGYQPKQGAQFRWCHGIDFQKSNKSLKDLSVIAEKQLGCDLASLAIAWVLKFKYTSAALIGARNIDQLKDCLNAIEVYHKITPELQARINKILDTHPPVRMNYRRNEPDCHMRPLAE